MSTFYLEIMSPERRFFTGEVENLIVTTPEGEIGILQGHTPLIVAVSIGPVKIKQDGEWVEAIVTEGFMEITNEKVVLLTDTAEWPNEININRAEQAKQRAEERLKSKVSETEYMRTKAAMTRASERLKLSRKYKGK